MFPSMVPGIYRQGSVTYRHRIIAEGALCCSWKYGNPRTRIKWWQEFLKAKKSSIPCWLQTCCLSARLDINASKELEINCCEICSIQYYQCDLQEQYFHCQEGSRCWKVQSNERRRRSEIREKTKWVGLCVILNVGRNQSQWSTDHRCCAWYTVIMSYCLFQFQLHLFCSCCCFGY